MIAQFATRIGSSAFALLVLVSAMPARSQAPPPVTVTVTSPIERTVTQWDEYSGQFEAVQSVEVRPRVSGFIDKIHFKDGQLVKAGDLLFTVDARPFAIAVDQAKAEVDRTKAQVVLQESEVGRATPLVESGAVTRRDLETRSANLAIAQAQLHAAEAGLKNAELNLEWTEVRAPIDGRVSDRKVDIGNLVSGGTAGATVLTTIVSLDPIHFVFEVSEADYLRYVRLLLSGSRQSGRDMEHPVRLKLADDKDWVHTGHLNFVDNQLNAKSGTLRGRAKFSNSSQLFSPGLFARLQLFGGETKALLIPDAAVVSDQVNKIVFLVNDENVVVPAPVELGALEDGLRIVKTGLKPTDRIVIDGLANPMVRPGAKVNPEPQGSVSSKS